MIDSPCKDCIRRDFNCHDRCSHYQEYKRRRQKAIEAEQAYGRLRMISRSKTKAHDKYMKERMSGSRH